MFKASLLSLLFLSCAWAWGEPSSSDVLLPEIKVYGASSRSSTLDFVPTISELSGTRLTRKKQSTIGETLARETGVTSSYFGPNASRPVIRALDGDRVRIMQNGIGVLDASAASQDHAVATDPLTVERVEIVRGPAALLYGSQAIGGVVNMVTNRIPEKVPEKSNGKAELRGSSTDLGRSVAVSTDSAYSEDWVVHLDVSQRAADDYGVPGYARTTPLEGEQKGRAYNSFNRTGSGAVGASYVFKDGFVGTSLASYESKYGVMHEPFVFIDMTQQRWDLAGEIRNLGFIKSVRAKNALSHYVHDEIEEGGGIGTSFKNEGDEMRIDFRHEPWMGYSGVFGLQGTTFSFSAKGEEKFLPNTENHSYALFFFEEKDSGAWRPSFGGRLDSSSVESMTDADFGPGSKKAFTAGSASLGLLYQVTASDALVLNSAYTERAPNYQELFAAGPHPATGIHEIGDPDLAKEESQSLELSWRNKGEVAQGSVGLFLQDFKNFIALSPNGSNNPGTGLPENEYQAVSARFYGLEADYRRRLPALLPGGVLELDLKLDTVRGLNRSTGDNLSRITPVRETVALIYKTDRYQADVEVQRSEKQDLTSPFETATPAYTFLNLGVEAPVRLSWTTLSTFARLNNVFNAEGRNHVSVLKEDAPLPGRNFMIGMQASF